MLIVLLSALEQWLCNHSHIRKRLVRMMCFSKFGCVISSGLRSQRLVRVFALGTAMAAMLSAGTADNNCSCTMYVCMYVCMDVWMYVWVDGWMDECMHVCMNVCMDGWMDVWTYACMYVRTYVSTYVCMHVYNYYCLQLLVLSLSVVLSCV